MKRRQGTIGEFEQLVLLAILRLKEEAYGPNISEELERKAGRRVSRGALYSSLDRLQQKGLLQWQIEATSSDRGGHPRRRFEVTRTGIAALREYRKALTRLWAGLEEVLG
ncbi:MAG: PadR family transcriptional regulator [Gemmatimonadota bacterium]|nr:MAG: PadR family transcriptional regulator [Gemmatimonadota bacterium]